jgi:hypothetical protein
VKTDTYFATRELQLKPALRLRWRVPVLLSLIGKQIAASETSSKANA